eukprot:Skav225720  [mRNA]  locus=scaffold164:133417:137497:+ [translate_table: standard]
MAPRETALQASADTAVARKSLGFIKRDWCIRRTENHWGNVLMRETEIVFTLFFTLECAIKIVAYGFVGHPSAYIRDPWNWIDFLVVVVGLLDAMQFEALSFLKPARVLRPLRSLTAVPGIRNLFHTIILSLPGLKAADQLRKWRTSQVIGGNEPLHFSPQARAPGLDLP